MCTNLIDGAYYNGVCSQNAHGQNACQQNGNEKNACRHDNYKLNAWRQMTKDEMPNSLFVFVSFLFNHLLSSEVS